MLELNSNSATSIVSETIGQCEGIQRSDGSIQKCTAVCNIQRLRRYNIVGTSWHSRIWCVLWADWQEVSFLERFVEHSISGQQWTAMSYGKSCHIESYVIWIAMSNGMLCRMDSYVVWKPGHMESHRNI